jgi:hypothetical protein
MLDFICRISSQLSCYVRLITTFEIWTALIEIARLVSDYHFPLPGQLLPLSPNWLATSKSLWTMEHGDEEQMVFQPNSALEES